MSLDKAIEHNKEFRKRYRGAKAIDTSCRNHGSCKWCEGNRTLNRNDYDWKKLYKQEHNGDRMQFCNLFKELEDDLRIQGYGIDDIDTVTIRDENENLVFFNIDKFLESAKTVDYDSGYGRECIELTLRVTMKDGSFFQRAEYDGSEWFEYYELREKTSDSKLIDPSEIMRYWS